MFDTLTERLGSVLSKLTRRGSLTGSDVSAAMREVRVALLEADVALSVVKDFIAKVSERAVGESVIKSVTPGQMVVKIVHDELVRMLGGDPASQEPPTLNGGGLDLAALPPVGVLMVGLQGSGKTTTTAKIAKRRLPRYLSSRRAGTARDPGEAGGRDQPADRRRREAGRDRAPRHGRSPQGRLRRRDL